MWYLDSYYLLLERKYRWKYQWIIEQRINSDKEKANYDYSFNLNPNEYNMWLTDKTSKEYIAAMKSIEAKNKNSLVQLHYHFKEIWLVMQSCTMIAEYFSIILISIVGLIVNTH